MGGVALRSFFDLGISFAVFAVFVSALAYFPRSRSTQKILFSVTLMLFAFGYIRAGFVPSRSDALLEQFVGRKIVAEGVLEEPDVRENSTYLTIGAEKIETGGVSYILPEEEKVLLAVRKYPEFSYGDRIRAAGTLSLPENFQNDDGRSFDYVSYLKKDGILYEMPFPKTETLASGQGNSLVDFLYGRKKIMIDQVSRILPEPHAGLLDGLIFGAKRAMGSDVLDMFRVAGIIHIVVLSGYNITIVADFITRFFLIFPLSRMAASIMGGIGVVLFAVMTGLGASTLRATVMALLAIFARVTGRTSEALHLLFVAAFFMVLWNPLSLLYDPSFQLSFLATLGLLLLGPEISRRFSRVTDRWGIRETLSATLSTQIFVLPLLLYETGMLSLVALPVNLLVLPMIPLAMFFGALGMLLGFITAFGTFFGFPVFLLLSSVFAIASFFAGLPFASVSVPQFSAAVLVAVYFGYAIMYFAYRKKQEQRTQILNGGPITSSQK